MSAITLVKQIQNIFSLPEIAVTINEIINSPDPKIAELEDVVLHDPALTAKLLKIVNSAYYGFENKIDTVSRAIAMLGMQELRSLVMGVAVTSQFENIPSHLLDMNTFWYHSVVKGVLAKILARHLRYGNIERFYIAGLLSSIGNLILFSQYPVQMAQILELPDQSDLAILKAEQDRFGFDYAELGAELLKEWKLPAEIWQMVYFQFDPLNENALKTDACLLHAAGKIANNLQPCHNRDFDFNAQKYDFNQDAIEYLRLTPTIIQSAASEAILYPLEILNIIHPTGLSIF